MLGLDLFLVLSALFAVGVYTATNDLVRTQAVRSITNISQLNRDSVSRALTNRRTMIETLVARIEEQHIEDVSDILRELTYFESSFDFMRMGLVDRDDIVHTTDGLTIDITGDQMIDQLWHESFHLSPSRSPLAEDGPMVNLFTCPIYIHGEPRYMLFASYASYKLTERMNIDSLEGNGYHFLLDRDGHVVIYPQNYADQEYAALMDYINENPQILPSHDGDVTFHFGSEDYYAHFEYLDINDWALLTCVKERVLFADARHIVAIVLIATGVLWTVIALIIFAIYHEQVRRRQNELRTTYYDELLGIGNANALNACYKNIPPEQLDQMYLVALDVDQFKEFNYVYGGEAGDELLRYLVRTIMEEFPQAYLFRYMSDCFVALHPYEPREGFAQRMQHLDDRVERDVTRGLVPPFEVSAGVRVVQAGEPMHLAFSDAMIARSTIKGNYTRHFMFYDGSLRRERLDYVEMCSAFPTALRDGEFEVYYQPKYEIRTGQLIGAEALARWIRPDGTMISPGAFVPCFEASSQIVMLDECMLEQVCRQMKRMEEDGLPIRPVSVNLSRVHLRVPDLLDTLRTIIRDTAIDPAMLSFEITESALLEEHIALDDILVQLHEIGCQVEMDDYGVGASSPDALLSSHFDTLKLDKSFVDRIGDERAEDLIRSIAHMGHKWGMRILAEGVETAEQATRLLELGCHYAQGFYYARPLPARAYRDLLQSDVQPEPIVPDPQRVFSPDICALLDGTLLPIYIIDPETFEVVYCNQAMRQAVDGRDPIGKLCYQSLRGYELPCENCAAMRLYHYRDGSPKPVNPHPGVHALLQPSPLHWQGQEYIQLTFMDITTQKQLEEELRLRGQEYEAILQQRIIGVMRYDLATDTATVNVNENLERVPEYIVRDCGRVARGSGMIPPASLVTTAEMIADIRADRPNRGYDIQIAPKNGAAIWCHFDYVLLHDEEGRPRRAIISFYDNTEQREKELAYQKWSAGLSALMGENTVYLGVDLTLDLLESENRFGTWRTEKVGQRYTDFVNELANELVMPDYVHDFCYFLDRERLLGAYHAGQQNDTLEYQARWDDHIHWYRVSVQLASDPATDDVKASVVFVDVDNEVRERERLRDEAERDSMTGLYNRATTERLIRAVLEHHHGERCCFMLIDLDDLRDINSGLGHLEGDRALTAIAATMRTKFRKGDILGRTGGDEFVAFLRNVPEADGLYASIGDLLYRLQQVSIGAAQQRPLSVSVGCAIGVAGKDDFQTLYEHADLALYYTKANGKNAFHFYTPDMEQRTFVYQPQSTALLPQPAAPLPSPPPPPPDPDGWSEAIEVRRLIKAISPFFPLVISVDLTHDRYRMMQYQPYTAELVPDQGCFSQVAEQIRATFHPDDRADFAAHYSRDALLHAYDEGRRIIGHQARMRGADGIYRVAQGVVLFIEQPLSDDVCAVIFMHVLPNDDEKGKRK
ncbi:MAG: EAL domain-containing protein [Eubacteriales bacterium]|nr:EAL domain-containing protein [Eubacteriales bacterium]